MIEASMVETGTGSYPFDVQEVTEANRFDVMARVKPFHDRLALAMGRTLEELYRNVDVGAEAVFITTKDPEKGPERDIAVVVERLKEVNIGGREYRVLMRFLRAVDPNIQGQGLGTMLTDEPIERLQPDAVTGRTPNPYVFRADEKSRYIATMHPIHRLHTDRTRLLLVATLDPKSLAKTNLRTGVCKGVYPPGENRLFNLEGASQRVIDIHTIMTGPEIDADLEAGDGIRYLNWVNLRIRAGLSAAA